MMLGLLLPLLGMDTYWSNMCDRTDCETPPRYKITVKDAVILNLCSICTKIFILELNPKDGEVDIQPLAGPSEFKS